MKIDKKIEHYILSHIVDEDPLLNRLYRETFIKTVNGQMCCDHLQGTILTLISRLVNPSHILEIGTFTGYSALCLVKGLSENGCLHTIEINEELEGFASAYFTESGMKEKIIQHIGDAEKIIPSLNETFDLVYLDADKRQYLSHYRLFFPKVRIGGIIMADNTLWGGKVVERISASDDQSKGIIQFNDFVKDDSRVETYMLPIRDGLMILRKIAE